MRCWGARPDAVDLEIVIAELGDLTRREAEAVLWIAQGKTSWEAGRILGVSEHTLATHIARASEKLGASNRAHLVARAFVRGILAVASKRVQSLLLALCCALHCDSEMRRPPRPPVRRREDVAAGVSR